MDRQEPMANRSVDYRSFLVPTVVPVFDDSKLRYLFIYLFIFSAVTIILIYLFEPVRSVSSDEAPELHGIL